MAVYTLQNPYHGVNAHLNSWLQTPTTDTTVSLWQNFHAKHSRIWKNT